MKFVAETLSFEDWYTKAVWFSKAKTIRDSNKWKQGESRKKVNRYNSLPKEAVIQWCSVKKVFLKRSQISQEITCARVSFLINLQLACNFIKKKDCTGVLLWISWYLQKHLFYRTPLVAASVSMISVGKGFEKKGNKRKKNKLNYD